MTNGSAVGTRRRFQGSSRPPAGDRPLEIAFYAPMKPPDDPVPSGDRSLARLLMRALRAAGHQVHLASRFRAYDGLGNPVLQAAQRRRGRMLALAFARAHGMRPPDLWFTYHCYYKAPDWIGPAVARLLPLDYVVAEASIAPKRRHGPWRIGCAGAMAAVRRADRVIAFDPRDEPCLLPHLRNPERLLGLAPFTDTAPWGAAATARPQHRAELARLLELDDEIPWLVAVAMMRRGAKLASYRLLARALRRLANRPWSLIVVGDGAARAEVEALFAGTHRVRFIGRRTGDALRAAVAAADLAVWPAIDEGVCMALLEAQAAGLPVVAGRTPGLARVVAAERTGLLVPPGDIDAFTAALAALLEDDLRRRRMGEAAARKALAYHDLDGAGRALDRILRTAVAAASR